MKKLLILMLVLGMASMANALLISVNGDTDPEDTSITLAPSQTAVIDIMGEGEAPPMDAFLIIQGPGSIAGHTMLYPGSITLYQELEEFAATIPCTPAEMLAMLAGAGYPGATDMSFMNFADGAAPGLPLVGKLVDDIIFHCEGDDPPDVILSLVSGDFATVFDTQIIHQIPEPMTVMLLGLGGLLLRRRK